MEAFLVSTGLVAFAEIGDKTQLLAFILAARFRQPLPIVLGIAAATLLNHALAAAAGAWITSALGPEVLGWVLGASFLAMAIWVLVPDTLGDGEAAHPGRGAFTTTLIAFFIAEIGDKTQIATVALAAQHQTPVAVVLGTTFGMLLANVPAVLLGERLLHKIPVRTVRAAAAAIFFVFGIAALMGAGRKLGM